MVLPKICLQYLNSRWHSPYILVYKDPFTNLPFGICAIYFDLKVGSCSKQANPLDVVNQPDGMES